MAYARGLLHMALIAAAVGQDGNHTNGTYPNYTDPYHPNATGGDYPNYTNGSYTDPYHPNATGGGYPNYTNGSYTDPYYPNGTEGGYPNSTGGGYPGSGAHWPPANVSEMCPEPVKSKLRQKMLWGLKVERNCSDGGVRFYGDGPMVTTYGRWEEICQYPMNYTLTISTMYNGLYQGCQSDADCMHIPCYAKCLACTGDDCKDTYQCTPVSGCMNSTVTSISPDEFVASCPPDPRDTACMELKMGWDAAGCGVFERPSWEVDPSAGHMGHAQMCMFYLEEYNQCIMTQFATTDYMYYMHRQVPPEIMMTLMYFMNSTGGNHTSPYYPGDGHMGGNHTNYTYPSYPGGGYMNHTGGNHTEPYYPGGGHVNISGMCPEPVRSRLMQRILWGLEVEQQHCADHGVAEFHADGPAMWTHGRWEEICKDPSNYSLVIYSSFKGLYEGCQSDKDCEHIPCAAKCEQCQGDDCRDAYQCMPMSSACHSASYAWISPDALRRECPRDPRDSACMDIKMGWDEAGCQVFEQPPSDGVNPDVRSLAPRCLEFVMQYKECIRAHFEATDHQYYMHRRVPDDIVAMLMGVINGTGGHKQCIRIPKALAMEVNAIPCSP